MFRKIPWTAPNILSVYRLCSMPFILLIALLGYQKIFFLLFLINQITDILDGYIARRYNLTSQIGALLDSWADIGSYLLALAGIVLFHNELLHEPYVYWIVSYLAIYLSGLGIAYIKFKTLSIGLHLYSSKLNGYILVFFLLVLFSAGLFVPLFYLSIFLGILTEIECVLALIILKTPIQNAKGIFWLLKSKKQDQIENRI